LTSSFLNCIPFISSSCIIALARNSKMMLNKSWESRHPCLILNFKGKGFNFYPFSMMLAIGLSYITFIMLRYIVSIPYFIQSFYHERMLNFVKDFFCICWDDLVVFVFACFNMLYYI
jgi:hypothetical protein